MSDAKQATPAAELERQICSATEPKNEREWWSHYEIARLRAALATERERADRAEAESEAVRALLRWPGDFCLSCGGDGGHEEACRGTTGLLALQAQRDELRERVARLVGAMEQIAQLDYTRGAVNMAATKANAIARAALGEGK